MAYPQFGTRSLQDDNYITESVHYRSVAPRNLQTEKIARRPGTKIVADEYSEKRITLKGLIIGDTSSDLQDKVDDLQQDLHDEEQTLTIEEGRNYTATVASLSIPDIQYNQTMVPFEAEFVCSTPFAEGDSQTVVWDIASGTAESDITTTITGTVFAVPTFKYTAPAGGGDTSTWGINIRNNTEGEFVTWSGTGNDLYLDEGSYITFNHDTFEVQIDGADKDFTGKFPRYNPGDVQIITSFSGTADGGTMQMQYAPRYY